MFPFHLSLVSPQDGFPIRVATGAPGGKLYQPPLMSKRTQILEWFDEHKEQDLYICNAPRNTSEHRGSFKGQAAFSHLVWTDVDKKTKVPHTIAPFVMTVASGTPGNRHFYIPLKRRIKKAADIILLNWLLSKCLNGEKYTDEALLRVFGSINSKTGNRVEVLRLPDNNPIDPQELLKLLKNYSPDKNLEEVRHRLSIGRFTPATTDAKPFTPTEFLELKRTLRRKGFGRASTALTVQDLPGFYEGNRYRVLYGFWKDLYNAGITEEDAIRISVRFEPALDKFGIHRIPTEVQRCYSKFSGR